MRHRAARRLPESPDIAAADGGDVEQKPLELILARNFLTSLSTPAFLADARGGMIFYNEAAGALLGISFEEFGRKPADEWVSQLGPFGDGGEPLPIEALPTTRALRQGRPAHGRFRIRSIRGNEREIESTALPIFAEGGQEGAMIFFWPIG
jgi:PAS domain-containing protein